jgi:hypothetical protein
MTASHEAERMASFGKSVAADLFSPEFLELKRYCHFYQFLREELEICRTDTEREVVLSALLTAQLKIQKLVKDLELPWAIET